MNICKMGLDGLRESADIYEWSTCGSLSAMMSPNRSRNPLRLMRLQSVCTLSYRNCRGQPDN